jgi:hypothetical protein
MSFTSIPIDPVILEEEQQFQISQGGGIQVTILVESEEEDEGVKSRVDSALRDY